MRHFSHFHSCITRRHSRAGGNPKYQRLPHKFYLTDVFVLDSRASFALAMQLNLWIPAYAGMTAEEGAGMTAEIPIVIGTGIWRRRKN